MSAALYPVLQRMLGDGSLTRQAAGNAVASSAEGYSFPTNLDRDPPLDGLAPPSQQMLLQQALAGAWSHQQFVAALHRQQWRRSSGELREQLLS
jgi:hypothetical protein